MSRSLRVCQSRINDVKFAVRRSGFPSQRALSEDIGLSLATVSNFLTGKPVDRATFLELCEKLSLDSDAINDLKQEADNLLTAVPVLSSPLPSCQDWGEAMDVSVFYGRAEELQQLQHWIGPEDCRLVALIGMGGVGKTALSIKLAEHLQDDFAFVIWRSLRNAPPLQDLLTEVLGVFSGQQVVDLPETVGGKITRLVAHLSSSRCLWVLDNAESILCKEDRAGSYLDGYDAYGPFFQAVGESRHQSCLVLTSREIPGGLTAKASTTAPIRSFRLSGLDSDNAEAILAEKDLGGLKKDTQALIKRYSGNPLALKIASTTIRDLFDGDVLQFLSQNTVVYGDISDLLAQQFNRLTAVEQQMMYWLAIAREPIALSVLQEDILPVASRTKLLESLESLQQRSLIEKAASSIAGKEVEGKETTFSQQPVVMEYVTERLIEQVCRALRQDDISLIDSHALSKAYTKDYLRDAQHRLILKPIVEKLQAQLGDGEAVKVCLDRALTRLKARPRQLPGYTAGNLINLFNQLGVDLGGYDFSNLIVMQVYLQGVNLRYVNFAGADLAKSVFTQTLGDILSIDFSPDSGLLATGIGQQVLLWRIADRRQMSALSGHSAWVRCVAFSPDGNVLASGSHDQTIRLWDVQTGQCLKTLRGHSSGIETIAFSPDGKQLVSGSRGLDLWLWDVETGQCANRLQGHGERILSAIFCGDGQTLVSTSDDCTVRVWDMPSGNCLQTIETHVNWLLSAAVSPDGKTLVTGSDSQAVKFWNLQTGECTGSLPDYHSKVWAVAFSPDGRMLATGSEDRTIRWWNVATRQCVKTLAGHTHEVWLVKFSPDGQIFVSSGEDQTIRLWDVISEHCLATIESHSNWVAAIAFSPDDRTLVSGSKDHQIRLWDVETGSCTRVMKGHSDVVTSVAFGPVASAAVNIGGAGEKILASGSDDRTIQLWQAATGERLKTLRGHDGWVQAIAFSPDGERLVSGSSDHTVKLWDVQSGECLYTLAGHDQRVKAVAVAPDGKTLASGSDDRTVKIWDARTGRCLQTLEGHTNWVLSVAYSPDGKSLASGSGDRTIKLWNLKTGKCLRTIEAHTHRVRSVAFSPDGLTLASASEDCQVKLWTVKTGECVQTLQGHRQIVWMVTFNHRGDRLASCSEDGTIRLWESETGECLELLTVERPYEGVNITGAKGLTSAQRATLRALGAIAD